MGRIDLITAASDRLVTLDQAKLHCRCQSNLENDSFIKWIAAAEEYCQAYTGRALLTSTWRWTGSEFPRRGGLDLLISPIQSITLVTYVDAAGDEQTLDAADYQIEAQLIAPKLWPGVDSPWPVTQCRNIAAVKVNLIAGYTAKELVPAQFTQAMLLIIGQWYKQREEIVVGTIVNTPPLAAERLLDQVASRRYV